MQDEPDILSVRILEDVIDSGRVEGTGSSDYAVYLVAFMQQELC